MAIFLLESFFLTSKHSESLFNDFDVTHLSTQVLPHKRRSNLLNWGGHHENKHFYWLQASSKATRSLRSDSILAFSSVYPTINGMYITTMFDTQMCTKRFVFSPNATCCYQMRLWVSMTCFHGDSIFSSNFIDKFVSNIVYHVWFMFI